MDINRIKTMIKAAIRTESLYMRLMGEYLDDYFGPGKTNDKPEPKIVAHMFGMMFKWPDVVLQLVDLMDNKPGSETQMCKDLESIIIVPLMTILSSYNEKAALTKSDRAEIDKQIAEVNNVADPVERSDKMIKLINTMAEKSSEKLPKV